MSATIKRIEKNIRKSSLLSLDLRMILSFGKEDNMNSTKHHER